MCDKKNSVLFTNTECVVLSPDFKLLDENHFLLRVPRKDNMYSVDLKNIVPLGGPTCLFVKATLDESNLWHRRLGHINFKTLNKLVRGNLVKGLPSKIFENNHTCVACQKGKQHKASWLFNSRNWIVEEYLHVKFSKETPNIAGNRPNWIFDIDALTISMNYKPVIAGNQTNGNVCIKENIDAGQARKKIVPDQEYILLPLLTSDPSLSKSSKDSPDAGFYNHRNIVYGCIDDPNMPNLEEIVYSDDDEEVGVGLIVQFRLQMCRVSPILTTRVHKDHPLEQIIRDIHLAPQTRRMTKNVTEHVEPKKVIQALTDPSWIEAMQYDLQQFKL
ncbi:ribonuclease H-like domain-containing protein [Tanacetum coccineum]